MADHELMSAKYLQHVETDSATNAAPAINDAPPLKVSSAAAWARASRWVSVFAGVALVSCILGLAVPYLTSASSGKKTSPIDWLIRLKGGKPDQTFEKWVRDSAEANQQEWQEMYRKSPAYQIDPSKSIDWHFEPQQGFGK
jgi:hypothetical protein